MKNRQKLTDDQLDTVSGGGYVDIENESILNLLNQYLCPGCRNRMGTVIEDNKSMWYCPTCRLYYTRRGSKWQKYTKERKSTLQKLFGC